MHYARKSLTQGNECPGVLDHGPPHVGKQQNLWVKQQIAIQEKPSVSYVTPVVFMPGQDIFEHNLT